MRQLFFILFLLITQLGFTNNDTINDSYNYALNYYSKGYDFFNKNELDSSLYYLLESKNYFVDEYAKSSKAYVKVSYYLSKIYFTIWEVEKFISEITQCIDYSKKYNHTDYEVNSYRLISIFLINSDDLMAVKFAEKGLQLALEKNIKTDQQYLYQIMMATYSNTLDKHKEALQCSDSVIKYAKINDDLNAALLNNVNRFRAISYRALNEINKSNECLEKLDSILESDEAKEQYYCKSLYATANTYLKINEFHKAKYYYEMALKQHNANPSEYISIKEIYTGLFNTYTELGYYTKTQILLEETKPLFTHNLPLDSTLNKMDYYDMLDLVIYYGSTIYAACLNQERILSVDSVLFLYESAYKLTLSIFTRFDFSSETIIEQSREFRSYAVAIMEHYNLNEFSNEQLSKFWFLISSTKSFDLVSKKCTKHINKDLNNKFRHLSFLILNTDKDDPKYNRYFEQYIEFCLKHQLKAIAREDNPYDVKILLENHLKVDSFINQQSNSIILDFYRANNSFVIFALSEGEISVSTFKTGNEFDNDLIRLKYDIKTGNFKNNQTFNKLENSIAEILRQHHKKNKIRIVPDAELYGIPFELMQYQNKQLISNFEISYNYSVNLISESISNSKEKISNILTLAPAIYNTDTLISKKIKDDLLSYNDIDNLETLFRGEESLVNLPYTIEEIKEIKIMAQKQGIDCFELSGNNATEIGFRDNMQYKSVIHFATHGISSTIGSEISSLILHTDTSEVKNSLNDAKLYFNEIYNLEINADLVVLSACKTGTGKIVEGEGVMALPRGFIYAGVPNVIASLW
ncbi:MAG: CHAT domain-containing protein, partial [Salinivirgaceae bacterium]|nr:CHAT domain-containing protein [Salinivirgaceae bacterium]